MSPMQHAFTEHSIVGTCIKLAQTTFYDALPANAEMRTPTAPEKLPAVKRLAREGRLAVAERFDNGSISSRSNSARPGSESRRIFSARGRMRHLERRPLAPAGPLRRRKNFGVFGYILRLRRIVSSR
jgi:hypothetical protein